MSMTQINVMLSLTFALWIFAAAALLLLAAFAYKKLAEYAFSRLIYSREFSDEGVFQSDPVQLIETLVNPTPIPLFWVDAEAYVYSALEFADYIPDREKNMQYMVSRFTLMPYMKVRRKHNLNTLQRGYYALENAQLWLGSKSRFVDSFASVYIYPKAVDASFYPRPSDILQGNHVSSRRLIADPFTFAGIRDYRFGDSMSSINFKASAKSPLRDYSAIKVNERDFCSNRNIMIYMNFQGDLDDPMPSKQFDKMMERAISFAAAFVFEAIREGYKVGFSANCKNEAGENRLYFPMLSGNDHYIELLKVLSTLRTQAGASVLAIFEKDIEGCLSQSEVFFLTPLINDEINEKIAMLERYSNSVNVMKLTADFGEAT